MNYYRFLLGASNGMLERFLCSCLFSSSWCVVFFSLVDQEGLGNFFFMGDPIFGRLTRGTSFGFGLFCIVFVVMPVVSTVCLRLQQF